MDGRRKLSSYDLTRAFVVCGATTWKSQPCRLAKSTAACCEGNDNRSRSNCIRSDVVLQPISESALFALAKSENSMTQLLGTPLFCMTQRAGLRINTLRFEKPSPRSCTLPASEFATGCTSERVSSSTLQNVRSDWN